MSKDILVGVDGSISALHAVHWSAVEAVRHGLGLQIVHAYTVSAIDLPSGYSDQVMTLARRCLHDAVSVVRKVDNTLKLVAELEVGKASDLLTERSKNSAMVVLGSRGRGGFAELLTGSTAIAVASRAQCPVVIVRGAKTDAPYPSEGPVVVGIDGSELSEAAIAFGYEAACLRNTDLVAVHTWSDAVLQWAGVIPTPELEWTTMQTEEEQLLAERLAGWADKYPDVRVRRVVRLGHPAQRLLDEAKDAQLVVVGSRGKGGFAGSLLGSTSQALLHHSRCPVAIVRPHETR